MFRIYFRARLWGLCACLLLGMVSISYANTTTTSTNTPANFAIAPLPAILQGNLMTAGVLNSGCPVALDDLRLACELL